MFANALVIEMEKAALGLIARIDAQREQGGGSDGNPDDVAAKVRADGGIADSQMVGDTAAAVAWMRAQPENNGKVGLFGSCSGGRHAVIYASQRKDVDACVDLWGGRIVMGKEELNAKTPVAPSVYCREPVSRRLNWQPRTLFMGLVSKRRLMASIPRPLLRRRWHSHVPANGWVSLPSPILCVRKRLPRSGSCVRPDLPWCC